MNIAISIASVGGTGGSARNIYTLAKAMDAHVIDIYTMRFIPRGLVPQGKNITIRWFEKGADGPRITLECRPYNLYIYYAARAPICLGNHLNARKKVVLPCGNDVRGVEQYFDYVICQAEDGIKYFEDIRKKVVIEPCVIIPADRLIPVERIPSDFFLTVFNPYDLDRQYDDGCKPCKGHDLLYEMADDFAMPLIWCHGDESVNMNHNIHEHPNIIHFHNLEQERMYYLYQKATAYVSFSREEGFGWSIADAVMFDKPIISRRIGVLSSINREEKGLYLYETKRELHRLLSRKSFEAGAYKKHRFTPARFQTRLMSLEDADGGRERVS